MKSSIPGRLMAVCRLGVVVSLMTSGCHFSMSFGEKDIQKTPAANYKKEAIPVRPGGASTSSTPMESEGPGLPPLPTNNPGSTNPHLIQTQYFPGEPALPPVHQLQPTPEVVGKGMGCPDGNCGAPSCEHGPAGSCLCALPGELRMRQHPPYVIEPPDIIKIDAVRLIPRPPYLIEPLDTLMIQVAECLPNQPINGIFPVSPDGLVSLGFTYGTVRVVGLTPEQAALAVRTCLKKVIRDPQVSVALAAFRGATQTQGVFLVGQDGTINLGTYGSVCIAGLTVQQAKLAIERHLSTRLLNPEIALEVLGYNSKVYYVIFDGAGFGEQVFRLPITGNDTVLSALSQLGGLPPVSSKRRIWLARPAPCEKNGYQILPINWEVITQAGDTETNYQLFPGDRIYVDGDPWITFDRKLAKIFAPIERVLGIGLLGTSTFNGFNNNGGVIVGGF